MKPLRSRRPLAGGKLSLQYESKAGPYSELSEAIQVPPPAPVVENETPTSIDVSWAGRPDEGL